MPELNDLEAVVDVAQQAMEAERIAPDTDDVFAYVLKDNEHVEIADVDAYRSAPRRNKGTVDLFTHDSLIGYVQENNVDDKARLFADVESRSIVAVLNGVALGEPGHGDWRANLTLRQTPAWNRWIKNNGAIGPQLAFAEHIEDSVDDIVSPPGAEMLELAQHFQATSKVAFKRSKRLADGQQQLVYEEQLDARAGQKGDITIPATFELGLQPFEGSARYKVVARLRYRMNEGRLAIGYILDRPEDVIRVAFDEILDLVEQGTGIAAYRGRPTAGA